MPPPSPIARPRRPAAFPAADGRSLQEVLRRAAPDKSVVVLPSGQVFQRGRNRFAFGVFTRSKSQVPDAEVALYVAPSGGGAAAGPFPARIENLQTSPAFRSQTVASDPDSADNVYVTSVPSPTTAAGRETQSSQSPNDYVAASMAAGHPAMAKQPVTQTQCSSVNGEMRR